MQGGSKVDVLLIAFLHLWLTFCKGIDKYWIVPVRKLFYFHHWCSFLSSGWKCNFLKKFPITILCSRL